MNYHKLIIASNFSLIILWYSCTPFQPSQKDLLSQNVDFLIVKGNEYWEKRVEPEYATWARNFLLKAHQMRPQDTVTGLLYSRACFFEGKYIEQNKIKRDSLFIEGALSALSIALNIDPKEINSETILNSGEGQHFLVKKIENTKESSLPALYMFGINLGEFIFSKPVRKRMQKRDLLESLYHRIYSLDPIYDFGGPMRLLGILYSRLPGMDLDQAKVYFDTAIRMYPNCFSHRTAKAEYYYIKSGDRESFHNKLSHIINLDPTIIPDIMPENLMEQGRAEFLLKQKLDLFE